MSLPCIILTTCMGGNTLEPMYFNLSTWTNRLWKSYGVDEDLSGSGRERVVSGGVADGFIEQMPSTMFDANDGGFFDEGGTNWK